MVASNRTEEVLECLKANKVEEDQVVMLFSQLRQYQQQDIAGITGRSDLNIAANQINQRVLTLLKLIEKGNPGLIFSNDHVTPSQVHKTVKKQANTNLDPSTSEKPTEKPTQDLTGTHKQQGELNPGYRALEQSLIQSPDESMKNHSEYSKYAKQPNCFGYFSIYKLKLGEIRVRMSQRRYQVCKGNLDDANEVLSIVKQVSKRLGEGQFEDTNADFMDELQAFKRTLEAFKIAIADPENDKKHQISRAVVQFVQPFCDELQKMEQQFEILAANSISRDFPPINLN